MIYLRVGSEWHKNEDIDDKLIPFNLIMFCYNKAGIISKVKCGDERFDHLLPANINKFNKSQLIPIISLNAHTHDEFLIKANVFGTIIDNDNLFEQINISELNEKLVKENKKIIIENDKLKNKIKKLETISNKFKKSYDDLVADEYNMKLKQFDDEDINKQLIGLD